MAIEDVKNKVQRILTDWQGSSSIDSDGDFFLRVGSATTYISVRPWGEAKTMIKIFAILARGVPKTPELFEWAATEGQYYYFGKTLVSIHDDGTCQVDYTHTLLGDYLDPEELRSAVRSVSDTADELDDILVGKFGGKKFNS